MVRLLGSGRRALRRLTATSVHVSYSRSSQVSLARTRPANIESSRRLDGDLPQ